MCSIRLISAFRRGAPGTPSEMRRGLVVPQARPTLTLELVLRHLLQRPHLPGRAHGGTTQLSSTLLTRERSLLTFGIKFGIQSPPRRSRDCTPAPTRALADAGEEIATRTARRLARGNTLRFMRSRRAHAFSTACLQRRNRGAHGMH